MQMAQGHARQSGTQTAGGRGREGEGRCRGEGEAVEKLGAAEKLLMNINRQLCCWPRNNPGLGLGQ